MNTIQTHYPNLIGQITGLLEQARNEVVKQINTTMVKTYRYIGKHIIEYEQGGTDRAEYGAELLKKLSIDLTKKFGKGFSERSLQKFRQFFLLFPNFADSAGGIQNLGWSHIVRIVHLKDSQEKEIAQMVYKLYLPSRFWGRLSDEDVVGTNRIALSKI